MKNIFFALLVLLQCSLGLSAPRSLTTKDIPRVMERFFSLHVEQSEITPEIVRRSFKVFLEKFDGDKVYLLESEVLPYLTMSQAQLKAIVEKYKRGDFSDYEALALLCERGVERAREMRAYVEREFLEGKLALSPRLEIQYKADLFAKTQEELLRKVRAKTSALLVYLSDKHDLSSKETLQKALQFIDKRVSHGEDSYLLSHYGVEKREHYFTTHLLKAFSKSLDAHSTFFTEEEAYQMRLSLQMNFQGVGVVLSEGLYGVVVSDIIKGSPAHLSGQIEVNDVVVEIDGHSVNNLSFEQVMELMKGSGEGVLHLGLMRQASLNDDSALLYVTLEKKPVIMEEERIRVSYEPHAEGIIGKITLRSFYESESGPTSEKDIRKAIEQLEQKGSLVGLVLDFRENAGGFLSQAVKVAGIFIKSGVIVVAKYAKGELHYLRTVDGKTAYNGPLVVLTSKLSASAAEITAQALQDYGVALVVGDERTFGKGSIQYQTVTDTNAELFFKVTVGKYYTASGRSAQLEGVKADIVIPSVFSPFLIGERFLEYPLKNDKIDPVFKDNLADLDTRTKLVFEKYYLPTLQRVVMVWKQMIPQLRKNSEARLKSNPQFQAFLKKLEQIQNRTAGFPVDLKELDYGISDMQMEEAIHILKDMIHIEGTRKASSWGEPVQTEGFFKIPLLERFLLPLAG